MVTSELVMSLTDSQKRLALDHEDPDLVSPQNLPKELPLELHQKIEDLSDNVMSLDEDEEEEEDYRNNEGFGKVSDKEDEEEYRLVGESFSKIPSL